MKQKKQNSKPLMAAQFKAEARMMLANRSVKQSRFIEIAIAKGRELEPVGRMAG
ncbi:hypothetical protein [Halopseudomonas sp.]|jgi:hypothetical protein|uniref:hypothetical protein n=1 Tax=Halopseudomonas sp. TaxID=2901191 RepID=UPI0039E3BFA8